MKEENLEKDMTPVLLEDLGMRYPTEKSNYKARYGLYQCQYCGEEFECMIASIKSEHTRSCGCLNTHHGLKYHPLYSTWNNIKDRCYNLKCKSYRNYGARGIKVCDRWLDIKNFIEDMFPSYQEGLSLDRIDVNGNYELDNCRWTTQSVQMCNTRDIKSNNTSGFRGVSWDKINKKWAAKIQVDNKQKHLGRYSTPLDAAKAYERYVRINNLEHNFTPALTVEEIYKLNL